MARDGDLQAGVVLAGRYRIERLIGAGGLGAVHEAFDLTLRRRVALKIMRDVDATPMERERFVQEAELCAQIDHPHVVKLFDYRAPEGDEPGFIVMELAGGVALDRRLAYGRMPVAHARIIADQLLSALEATHAAGVVHRDIKPSNVILRRETPEPDALLVDFGIATLAGGEARVVTTSGTSLGTPGHMAPEQIRSEEADARTDLYAIGVCLFRMLTGRLPFAPGEQVRQIAGHPAPRASSLSAEVPAWLDAVIAKALEANPDKRFASASAMRAALRAGPQEHGAPVPTIDEATTPSPGPGVKATGRRAVVVAASAVVLVATSLIVAWTIRSRRSATPLDDAASDAAPQVVASVVASEVASLATPPAPSEAPAETPQAKSAAAVVVARPPSTAAGPRCHCVEKMELCEKPQPPRCGCNAGANLLCTETDPKNPTRCARPFVIAKPGQPCRGRRGSASGAFDGDMTEGVFSRCGYCYAGSAQKRTYRGAEGDACNGTHDDGTVRVGKLVCSL